MRTDLLQSLIIALRNLLADCPSFNMWVWANKFAPKSPKLDCGSSACAIGLASTLPDWKEAGLKLVYSPAIPDSMMPVYKTKTNCAAIARLLEITMESAAYLFDPGAYPARDGYISPHTVADRIEQFIEEKS